MKVIFLDHYGVMVLSKDPNTRREIGQLPSASELLSLEIPTPFDVEAIDALNYVISKTDAEIIISSDWSKSMTYNELCQFYKEQGIIKEPIGYIKGPSHNPLKRGNQILNYKNSKIQNWIAIDDLYLGENPKFIWCQFPHMGITEVGIPERMIRLLNHI